MHFAFCNCDFSSKASTLVTSPCCMNSVLVMKSLHWILRMEVRQHWWKHLRSLDGDGGNPQLQAVQMGSEDNSTVHFDLGALFQEFFLFHTHLNSLPKAQFTCASLQSISCQCWHQVQWHTQVSQKSSYQWCKEGTTLPVAMRMGNKSCIVSKEEITDQLLKGLCVDLCWTSSHEMVSGVSSILVIQRYSSLLEYHVKEDC